ncbi:BON domain-containing protein [Methyloglobulus sp.]|uniref:BON domain-containing protein n=1 Tax=Methyloglobulus sp. TaxID=2518622 RepID=UPI00398A4178
MFTRLLLVMYTVTGSLILMTGSVQAEKDTVIYLAAGSALENTQRNVRDKDGTTLTPEDQNETESDINITANIRKAAVKDEALSVNAQNVKIITNNRVVTLRGIVENVNERMKLENIAKKTRGVIRIDNQLEIKAP